MPREDEFAAGPYDLSAPPDWDRFPGLYPPLYTQTPDVFFDWVAPFLPEIELRVLLYLIRRTLGFKKQGDQITVEQIAGGIVTRDGTRLDWGAQIGERSVQRALAGLEAKCLIERHRQLDPERGWRPSYIRLRLCDQSGQVWQSRSRQAHPGVQTDTRGASIQSPPWRTAGHLPGVGGITPHPQAPSVRPDTYKRQRSNQRDLQETEHHPTRQETGAPSEREMEVGAVAPSRPRSAPGDTPGDTAPAGDGDALWDRIKEELASVLAPAVYQARVAATRQACRSGDSLTVICPDLATGRWLEHRLGRMVDEIAAGLADPPPAIRFIVPD